MRKILATAAALGLAGLGVLVPVGGAQAATPCDAVWSSAVPGYLHAYDGTDCATVLGRASGDDANWGDSSGPFQGGDTNRASSVLHKGASGLAVKILDGTGQDWDGGHVCLTGSQRYASDLSEHTFSDGTGADNAISSHTWVLAADCGTFL
ncbi:hypothetical protein [Streptomyces brasiliscabiei]|uniref:hypothetical protein n=1 Tax=Streptomyces brasiliscabiei TaxID=2736302 RepID=UPI001C0FB23A|nr:hypothetical protein [Streptomyces brasiliscabiei]